MDMITHTTEDFDVMLEDESPILLKTLSGKDNGSEHRYYGATTIYDVLDPYAAVIEGIKAQDPISCG